MPTRRIVCWAALTACYAVLAAACRPAPEEEAAENVPANVAEPPRRVAVLEPPMDRAALIDAVSQARSAAALGRDDMQAQRRLDGKRFEVRIRFGCPASVEQAAASDAFGVLFDQADRTLRVSASPDLSLEDPQVAEIAGKRVEAVEGFWVHRPWLLTDGCPAVPPQPAVEKQASVEPTIPVAARRRADARTKETAEPAPTMSPTAPSHRFGLAQFFTDADPRTGRRDHRAYEVTKVLREAEQPSREGYNLVLSGRLRQQPGGRVVQCRAQGADEPPQCIVSVQFDRVWVEQPGSRDVLAEWAS